MENQIETSKIDHHFSLISLQVSRIVVDLKGFHSSLKCGGKNHDTQVPPSKNCTDLVLYSYDLLIRLGFLVNFSGKSGKVSYIIFPHFCKHVRNAVGWFADRIELSVGFPHTVPNNGNKRSWVMTIQSKMISSIFNCHGFFKVPKKKSCFYLLGAKLLTRCRRHHVMITVHQGLSENLWDNSCHSWRYSYESIIKL